MPLGVGQIPHQQASFVAPARSILVLYTDGLVETRHSDLDLQIEKVGIELEAACAEGTDLDKIADRVIGACSVRAAINWKVSPTTSHCCSPAYRTLPRPPRPPNSPATPHRSRPGAGSSPRYWTTGAARTWPTPRPF